MSFHPVTRWTLKSLFAPFVLIAMFFGLLAAQAREGESLEQVPTETVTDQQLVEQVIAGQLQAFQDRDLTQALAFADAPIVAMFQSPERFGEMVESGYEPIYNNQSHEFVQYNQLGAQAVQVIMVKSASGTKAIAQYRLSKTSGSWRISGVMMQVL